jgi:hypothetical protein
MLGVRTIGHMREAAKRLQLWRRAVAKDVVNIGRYGFDAPLWCQRIWIEPSECIDSYGRFKVSQSGQVIGGDWDLHTYPIERNPIASACLRRWTEGISWEEVGAYDLQLERITRYGPKNADNLRTRQDIIARYQRLDHLYQTIRAEGRLRPRKETDGFSFRERDGVLVHVARDCRPVFGQRGVHRLVISRLLGIERIPAQIGVVHLEALRIWKPKFTMT